VLAERALAGGRRGRSPTSNVRVEETMLLADVLAGLAFRRGRASRRRGTGGQPAAALAMCGSRRG